MNSDFPRVLTLLRKERGFSQKSVAQQLQVSQALLSHYEKGIREPGLAFVVRAADFYRVPCDYLLGRSADSSAQAPAAQASAGTVSQGLVPAVQALDALVAACGSEPLCAQAADYLGAAVYRLLRTLCGSAQAPFTLRALPADGRCAALMENALANLHCLLDGQGEEGLPPLPRKDLPTLHAGEKRGLDPQQLQALLALVARVEARLAPPRG